LKGRGFKPRREAGEKSTGLLAAAALRPNLK
jgi:hypothetical protein